ncbi:MAG: GNAT family N-acetyltransferase [Acidobacteriota bacterium]|nr:GNAT family N-acetyltransferase [Acidobacteriota bacterium]
MALNEETENGGVALRPATAADAPALARLRFEFRLSTGPVVEAEAEFVRRCSRWMEERLRGGGAWRCWIAERDHAPVGQLWAQLIEKMPNPSPELEYHAYLTNFYVREDARGRGVGSMLLSAALEWCRARQVHAAILWPTERSRPLYRRYGFAVRQDLMELIVGGKRP